MSHSYYGRQWSEAQAALSDLLQQESPPDPPKPEKDRLAAFQLLATMYIKYVQIFRKLEHSYDQIVHPQKRRVLRHVLDGCMGRVLELKDEMVKLEFSEYHYFDDVLSDLKLTPASNDIEMPVPKYFTHERSKALKEREKLLGQILAKLGPQDKDSEVTMSLEDAIRMIQIHERARQGRLRAKFMREIRQQEEDERMIANRGAPTLDPDVAATRIQKLWKGFSQRRKTTQERIGEMMFIGMIPPPLPTNLKMLPQNLAVKTETDRRRTQEIHEQEYQQALITIKDKIRESEGPDMKERMQDQIRQWFIECRDASGKFPEYPDEDEGGSGAIFKEKDPAEIEAELKAKEDGKDGKGKKGKKEKKDKKKDKKEKKGKKGDDDEEDEGWKMAPSSFVPAMGEATETYSTVWEPKDEGDNFSQKHDVELIKEEKRMEVETEVRVQIDELMRQELKNLKLAVDRDKGKKGKKGKSGKKKKKGKKSGKKGKKGKKEKDLTPDRTIESLYEELVTEGIIVRHPKVTLTDYEGEYSYLGTTLRQASVEPMPSLSDVRRLVAEFAILPIGSPSVHEKAPLIKSVMLAGPRGTGKHTLVHAICTETGANLFDLTATNIAGKYPGKDGLKLLMHMIFKVGRALQPSVIYIGECEKMFKKKVPKTDLSDPKRLKKELPKALKTIKPEDRILLVGTTRCPFDGEMKPMASTYQKIVLIPRPDYASRHLLWRKLITRSGGQVTSSLDVSSLAKITDGYTPGQMVQACTSVLSERRINQLAKKPLVAAEFIAPLARLDPVYKEEEESFKTWYSKTPLGKKRAKAAQGDDEEGGGKKGGKKGGKGKKGKKKK
ncbi:hypothetical protein CAPTEDRAFT_153643 [Capitella teleta]|uniref:ATPase AAA-type core domain-containing protein n=1 Tax=Capitella teleta TaxID=283909 RepID=R7UA00_CAPTE|nr:hypothetical protein CAPTEDRAFT_153643 [Capitella teleta]|eukprot:ELU03195.1 hypothetical protein CAPTEDRAFT_153643 [Capitella teleta]